MSKLVKLVTSTGAFNSTVNATDVGAYVNVDAVTPVNSTGQSVAVVYAGGSAYRVMFTAGTHAVDVDSYVSDLVSRTNA